MSFSFRRLLLGAACFATTGVAYAAPEITGFSDKVLSFDPGMPPALDPQDHYGIALAGIAGNRALLEWARRTSQEQAGGPDPRRARAYFATLADATGNRMRGAFGAANFLLNEERVTLNAYADPAQHLNTLVMLLDLEETGNAFLANDMHGWAIQRARLDALYLTPLRRYYRMPNLRLEAFDRVTLDVSPDAVPSPRTVEAPENHIDFLPSGHSFAHKILLSMSIPATIGGGPGKIVVNTGEFSGTVPESYATSHHLKAIGTVHKLGDGNGFFREARLVVMPDIRIGNTTLVNQIFVTAPIETTHLGLQQLATLHHVTMDKNGISFGADHAFSCSQQLRARAQRAGYSMELLFPVALNDDHFDAILTTGDDTPEVLNIRTRQLPAPLEAHKIVENINTSNGFSSITVAHDPAWITIGSALLDDAVLYNVSSAKMIPAITSSVLRYTTFKLDFSEHVACLDSSPQSE